MLTLAFFSFDSLRTMSFFLILKAHFQLMASLSRYLLLWLTHLLSDFQLVPWNSVVEWLLFKTCLYYFFHLFWLLTWIISRLMSAFSWIIVPYLFYPSSTKNSIFPISDLTHLNFNLLPFSFWRIMLNFAFGVLKLTIFELENFNFEHCSM